MDPTTILVYVSIVFVVVVGVLLSIALYKVIIILSRVERITAYADHVRYLLSVWEKFPAELAKRLFDRWAK